MDRITKRIDDTHACYAICEKECPDGIYADNPACMCAASKMAMKRLLEYEDTGLTPEQIRELKERDTAKAPEEHDGHWYKILEEIDETIERYGENPYIDGKVTDICYGLNIAKDIIRKHMNDGWISVEERLPEISRTPEEDDECPEFNVTIRRAEGATTLKYSPADDTWFDDNGYVYDVIAWRPLPEPYRPERSGE